MNKLLMTAESNTSGPQSDYALTNVQLGKYCKHVWTLPVQNENELITVTLKKRKLFGKNREWARVALPLCWFPKNRVVRDWFPLFAEGQTSFALLDVHISESDSQDPWDAKFAQLTILPGWERPIDPNGTFEAPPQVYVVEMSQAVPMPMPPMMPMGPQEMPPMTQGSMAPMMPMGAAPGPIPSFGVPSSVGAPEGTPAPYGAATMYPQVDLPVIADPSSSGVMQPTLPGMSIECPTVPINVCD